jgi:adenosylcobinamide kinase/adenosylcobinamide-phosphate guanylyltransferase
MSLHLILGGTRSGKSTHAERLAAQAAGDQSVLYAATAEGFDDGMKARIARHRAMRPTHWRTLEAPVRVGEAIRQAQTAQPRPVVLVECLTLLACTVLCRLPESATAEDFEKAMDLEVDGLLAACRADGAHWIVVSSETGLGVMPATRLGVLYADGLGRANQRLAQAADQVTFMVAGIPWKIK